LPGCSCVGSQIVKTCIKHGAKVAFIDVESKTGTALQTELGNQSWFSCVDVTVEDQVQTWIDAVVAKWNRVDVLVNKYVVCG
jgi:NADP-dependent 3-hydroxy acid dehydrogenase YdfG